MANGVIIRHGASPEVTLGLPEILEALGDRALDSWWTCSDLNYVSRDDRDVAVLDAASVPGGRVKGAEFLNGLVQLLQVIDGVFTATDADGRQWVTVRAVDSSWWEVWSDVESVITMIKRRYREAESPPRTR